MSWMRCIMRSRMHTQPQDMTFDTEPRYPTALRGNLAGARAHRHRYEPVSSLTSHSRKLLLIGSGVLMVSTDTTRCRLELCLLP